MLTLFATPKPMHGAIATLQRNALASWLRLEPRPELLLVGEEEGVRELAREHGAKLVPELPRNEHGTPLVSALFELASAHASHDRLCYVNCDIILLGDFMRALERLSFDRFLMVGRRWDLDLPDALDTETGGWEDALRAELDRRGRLGGQQAIDYFAFSRGLWESIPPFALGRTLWDNWLVWSARASGAAVVDATEAVTAVHQSHDYAHHPGGKEGVWQGAEAQANWKLLSRRGSATYGMQDANWLLRSGGRLSRARSARHLWRRLATSAPARWLADARHGLSTLRRRMKAWPLINKVMR